MEVEVSSLGPCLKKVAVVLPPEAIREEFDRQYGEINDAVALPGFRKGRAPRKLLEKRFAGHLGKEVKEKLVQKAVEKMVEDKRFDPLQAPSIDLDELELVAEAPFSFEFEVVTKPEFETPTWKELEVKVPPVAVTEEDVQEALEGLLRHSATLQGVEDAAIQDEDVLVVDWEARDGDSVEAKDMNAYYAYGRGVIAGFVAEDLDAQLEGKGVGATATSTVRVAADDHREELRGRELQLEVEVKEVKRFVLPDVDEAFLSRHDYDDEKEMREDLKKRLRRARTRDQERTAEDRLVERLVEGIEMSLPEAFVAKELEGWARRTRTNLEVESIDEDEITKRIDAERGDAKANVEAELRRFFLLDRIADEADVKVTETDLYRAIQEIANAYGRPEEEVLASFRDGGRLAELSAQIRQRKVKELIRRAATVVEEAEASTPKGGKASPAAKRKAAAASKAPEKKKAKAKAKKSASRKKAKSDDA